VADGDLSVLARYGKRLDFLDRVLAGGGISRVANGGCSVEFFECVRLQDIGDKAVGTMFKEIFPVGRDDTAGFLSAMLKCKKAELRQGRRLFVAKKAKDTALLVKFVENVLDHR